MRLRRGHPVLTAAALSIVGALVAGAIAFNRADRFASRGTLNVRPASSSRASETASLETVVQMRVSEAFSRDALLAIITRHDLYYRERARSSTDDVVQRNADPNSFLLAK